MNENETSTSEVVVSPAPSDIQDVTQIDDYYNSSLTYQYQIVNNLSNCVTVLNVICVSCFLTAGIIVGGLFFKFLRHRG